jgi:DnaJ like chaperone protein
MAKYGKWFGGILGWTFGGPIGGLFGFALGSLFDAKASGERAPGGRTTQGDFIMSLLVLVAAVMKADGKVVRSELNYVKAYIVRAFGQDSSGEIIRLLGDLLKQEIPVFDVANQIRSHMDYPSRLELLHLLFGISKADGNVSESELKLIEFISKTLGVEETDYMSIKNMFVEDSNAAYRILEISHEVSDDEVKKAYRKMAVKYHPDKVSYLGEDVINSAKEKFQKVNEAYEIIKKQRNIA